MKRLSTIIAAVAFVFALGGTATAAHHSIHHHIINQVKGKAGRTGGQGAQRGPWSSGSAGHSRDSRRYGSGWTSGRPWPPGPDWSRRTNRSRRGDRSHRPDRDGW